MRLQLEKPFSENAYLEDFTLCLRVWVRKLDFSIDPSWPDQCRVKRLDAVGSQNHLHVSAGFKTVQLVEELQHGALDFFFSTTCCVVPK